MSATQSEGPEPLTVEDVFGSQSRTRIGGILGQSIEFKACLACGAAVIADADQAHVNFHNGLLTTERDVPL